MPTSFLTIGEELMTFCTGIGAAARIFTTKQVAAHEWLAERGSPTKRASEFLHSHSDVFERIHGIYPYKWLWRLRREYKRAHGMTYRNVNASQRAEHWLAFGDLWVALYRNHYRVQTWFTEGKLVGGFDIYMEVGKKAYLIEMQLSPLTAKEWRQKWYRRGEWIKEKPWEQEAWREQFSGVAPKILLITREGLRNVLIPKAGVIHIPTIQRVPYVLRNI